MGMVPYNSVYIIDYKGVRAKFTDGNLYLGFSKKCFACIDSEWLN